MVYRALNPMPRCGDGGRALSPSWNVNLMASRYGRDLMKSFTFQQIPIAGREADDRLVSTTLIRFLAHGHASIDLD